MESDYQKQELFAFDCQKCGNPKRKMFPSERAGDIDSTERSKNRFKKWGIAEVVVRLIFAPCSWNDVQCLMSAEFLLFTVTT